MTLLFEIAWRHLLGGRFSLFLRYRWRRWVSALVAFAADVAIAVQLAMRGYPVWGAVSLVGLGIVFGILRRFLHGPLPEHIRGAYASAVTFVAILGITIAVMTLIVVISVMDGFSQDIQQALLRTTPEITVTTFEGKIDPAVTERLLKIEGVTLADPFMEDDMLMRIEGIDRPFPIKLKGKTVAAHSRPGGPALQKGSWAALDTPGTVIVGAELARLYMLNPGDSLWMITSGGAITPMGIVAGMQEVEVVGVFKSGFYEVDQSMILSSLQTSQEIMGVENIVTGIEVRGGDPYQAPALSQKIEQEMAIPLVVMSWARTRQNLYEAMKTEKAAMFIIESLLILIASFNISSTLFMAVGKKTREIGLLLSLGMSRSQILALFSLEGLLIGVSGTTFGALLGVGFSLYLKHFKIQMPGGGSVYYIDTIPVSLSWGLVFAAVAFSIVVSLAASFLPAMRASQLSPSKALKYE